MLCSLLSNSWQKRIGGLTKVQVAGMGCNTDDHSPDQNASTSIPTNTHYTVENGTVLPGYANPVTQAVPISRYTQCYLYPCHTLDV